MSAFHGFSPKLADYLEDLEDHNGRDWFNEHKDRYTEVWLEPAVAFVDDILPRLAAFNPPIHGASKVNGSIWRIQRDTRFSKDKTPYKTHQALRFWYGDNKKSGVGFYFRISAAGVGVGAGLFHMEKAELERYRQAVADPAGEAFQSRVDVAKANGWKVGGEALKRVPRGFDADHARAELLKHKGIYLMTESGPDARMFTAEASAIVVSQFQACLPVADWLREHVTT